ncbi:MAG: hypothetical protein R2710_20250 [Acidimicrobiales bacterium]
MSDDSPPTVVPVAASDEVVDDPLSAPEPGSAELLNSGRSPEEHDAARIAPATSAAIRRSGRISERREVENGCGRAGIRRGYRPHTLR